MCVPALLAAVGAGGAAGAGLQALGTIASVGGAIVQGIAGYSAGKQQAAAIREQRATEARLTATEEARTQAQFRRAMRKQAAELAGRGIVLSSPTAEALGQTAAQEMAFAGQEVRARGAARDRELSAEEKIARGQAFSSLLKGGFSAAGTLLSAAPDLWPEWGRG